MNTARSYSARSVSGESVASNGSNGSGRTRYRRVSNNAHVDETLFGSKNLGPKSRQTGRTIVGADVNMSNNNAVEHTATRPLGNTSKAVRDKKKTPPIILRQNDLERMKQSAMILTPSDIEDIEAAKEREQEELRMEAKERKIHMQRKSKEAESRAPKSDIEKVLDSEKEEIRARAQRLLDHDHDSVKLIKTLGTRAAAFTIRDQQMKDKEQRVEEDKVYDEKMNLIMELNRLADLKRQEDIEEDKRRKRFDDRKVLEDQISDRRRAREAETRKLELECAEVLDQIKKDQEAAVKKEQQKAENAKRATEEILHFNEQAKSKKLEVIQKIKDEEEKIAQYQRNKMEQLRLQEEEEERKKQEAEMRCALLRSTQEKVANDKAELDELRAKRAAEARERSAREAELAQEKRMRDTLESLRIARQEQALHKQRALEKEAEHQKKEYESMKQQVQKDRRRMEAEQEQLARKVQEHRESLQAQIEYKEKLRRDHYLAKREEGSGVKDEFEGELQKLERIRREEVDNLIASGVNPKYLSEMKNIDLSRVRDC